MRSHVAVALAVCSILPATADAAEPRTVTYLFTGAPQEWVVPQGVTSASFDLVGGRGGDGSGPSFTPFALGGAPARSRAVSTVVPGARLQVRVGGRGGFQDGRRGSSAGGFNGGGGVGLFGNIAPIGGGGGGASDARSEPYDLMDRLVIAGGGGGGGGNGAAGPGGAEGPSGGAGGSAVGAGAERGSNGLGLGGNPGSAGTDVAGGTGGTDGNGGRVPADANGSLGRGGVPSTPTRGSAGRGGGGGGGLYGGGAGGAGSVPPQEDDGSGAGGGGAGSSLASGGTVTTASRDTAASVSITYVPGPPVVSVSTPTEGEVVAFGAATSAAFACSDEPGGGPGIATCTDADGRSSGQPLDTITPGERTLEVTARTADGRTATVRRRYVVGPPPAADPPPGPSGPPAALPLPPAPAAPGPALPLALCGGVRISLVDLTRSGGRVRVAGIAEARFAGRTVTLRPDRGPSTRVRVAADGAFSASVRAPRARSFQASLGSALRSASFRVERRLTVLARRTGPETTRVTFRLALRSGQRAFTADVLRQTSCTKRTRAGRVNLDRTGRGTITLPNPVGSDPVALYRVVARLKSGKAYSVPIAVLAR